jgi:hypothetical protein
MPCYCPLQGYRSKEINVETGKRPIVFNARDGYLDMPVDVPCGQCVGCRLERSRQWAIRCVHEASLYDRNCFITLTFAPEHLPKDNSLDVRHFQLFMKRLRKKFGDGVRFYHCGEYGENYGRPHYHALLFNCDFDDKVPFKEINGNMLYVSKTLSDLWPYGHSSIGEVTFDSAAYVARYVMKKVTGDAAAEHYSFIDPETGEVLQKKPEYTTMSRRPGIGRGWYDKYHKEVYPHDSVIMNGHQIKPPKFYDRQLEQIHNKEYVRIKRERVKKAKKYVDNNTSSRLRTRMRLQELRLKLLPRSLPEGV